MPVLVLLEIAARWRSAFRRHDQGGLACGPTLPVLLRRFLTLRIAERGQLGLAYEKAGRRNTGVHSSFQRFLERRNYEKDAAVALRPRSLPPAAGVYVLHLTE